MINRLIICIYRDIQVFFGFLIQPILHFIDPDIFILIETIYSLFKMFSSFKPILFEDFCYNLKKVK